MVRGADKTSARRKRFVRTPNGTVTRYEERKPSSPRCPSGRPLPGVASGSKNDIRKLSKTQRRPSRPFGGVLSAPVMKAVLRDQAREFEPIQEGSAGSVFGIGRVCLKVAGRDAGKVCVVVNSEGNKVLVDGQTRRRLVNTAHLEPTGHMLKVSKDADHAAVVKALESIDVNVVDHVPQKKRLKAKK